MKDIIFSFSQAVEKTRIGEVLSLSFYRSIELELIDDLQLDLNKKISSQQVFRFISCDDKAKIPIGEPNYPISTGCRQRTGNIVPVNLNSNLTQVLDHDFSKASITPSIELDMMTPKKEIVAGGTEAFILFYTILFFPIKWMVSHGSFNDAINKLGGVCSKN